MNARRVSITAVVVAGAAVGAYLCYYHYLQVYHGYTPLEFSREAWASADAEHRGHMADDLLAQHRIKGMTYEQVVALLGQPDGSFRDDQSGKVSLVAYELGYRGFNRNAPMVFSYGLLITFGSDGRAVSVGVHD